jgi:hypothetical protein
MYPDSIFKLCWRSCNPYCKYCEQNSRRMKGYYLLDRVLMIYLKINDIPVLSKFTSVTEMLNKRLDVFELKKVNALC